MKTLVILSHPNLGTSIANKTIISELETKVDNIEVRHIEALYPDFKIDVEAEQKALLSADIIIFQHPFYWYSTPAGLKQWMDEVLSYGFAYGHDGDKLKGKHFLQSLTVGGPEESYRATGYNHFTVEELLRPMEQTVYLSMMVHHGFVHTHRNAYIEGAYNSRREVEANARQQAQQILNKIKDISTGDTPHILDFVKKWFAGFDDLDETSFFTQYLASDVKMSLIDTAPISDIQGFRNWYEEAKQTFETPTEHILNNVVVSPTATENQYDVTMDVELKAVLTADQSPLELKIKEKWLVEWDSAGSRPTIKQYDVWQEAA